MARKGMVHDDGSPDAVALARASGISDVMIRRYLNGSVAIGLKNAPRLAKPLGLKPVDLVSFEDAA